MSRRMSATRPSIVLYSNTVVLKEIPTLVTSPEVESATTIGVCGPVDTPRRYSGADPGYPASAHSEVTLSGVVPAHTG